MRYTFLFALLLFISGCRTVKKSFATADSSAVKTDQSSEKYNRETITEYVKDTTLNPITINVAAAKQLQPYIIRQTVRESGEVQKDTKEEVKTSETQKDKEAGVPMLLQWAAIMLAGAVLLLSIGYIIKQFR